MQDAKHNDRRRFAEVRFLIGPAKTNKILCSKLMMRPFRIRRHTEGGDAVVKHDEYIAS